MCSLNGAYPNRLQEKSVYAFMTSADRLLNNHEVISEDRNSCYRQTSAQSNKKMGDRKIISTFVGLQKHFLFISFFMIEAYAIGLVVQNAWR